MALTHAIWTFDSTWIGGAWENYSQQTYEGTYSYHLPIGENLYELRRDPAEAYNVAKTRPEIAADLGRRLQEWRSEFLANPRGWREREVAR